MSARRWPWATTSLIAINLTLFLFFTIIDRRTEQLIAERGVVALAYYQRFPYLELKPPLSDLVGSRTPSVAHGSRAALGASSNAARGLADESRLVMTARQAELDSRVSAFGQALDRVNARSFAYIPQDNNGWGLVSYQFMHSGWLHLLGNLWLLWLTGCAIEDIWGRRLFSVFYVGAGVAAALVHKLEVGHSAVPLLGASGAIAGVMGAFFYRFARTKVRLFVLWLRIHVWHVPAYLILGLWLVTEIYSGFDSVKNGANIAHFAHLGGFVYGFSVAWLMRATGLEQRIDHTLDSLRAKRQDARILQAEKLIAAHFVPDAILLLKRFCEENPESIDAQLVLARAARISEDETLEQHTKARLVELYLKNDMPETALAVYEELATSELHEIVHPSLRMRIARHFARTGRLHRASLEYEQIVADPKARSLLPSALLGQAEIAFKMGRHADAVTLFQRAERAILHQPELEGLVRLGLDRARRAVAIAPPVAGREIA